MIHRIEIAAKVFDTRADVRRKWLKSIGIAKRIRNIDLVDVYTIEKDLTPKQLKQVTSMLSNPISQEGQEYSYKKNGKSRKFNAPKTFSWAIEVGLLPGVTDNLAATAKEAIEDLLKITFQPGEGVYTTQMTFILGNLSRQDAIIIAENLANPLIQRISIKSFKEFQQDNGMDFVIPRVKLVQASSVGFVDLNVSDEELINIGKLGIVNGEGERGGPLALDLTYMQAIKTYFSLHDRTPTDIELESLAQTWSEHCKHTIFADAIDDITKGLFKTYIKGATEKIRKLKGKKDFCVSVFTDNSGAIRFDDTYLITHKAETHNSPSALDPFGGAVTGIVGVNRDALGFGLGAKPIINTYGFCFADPNDSEPLYRVSNFRQKMLSPRRIMKGVIEGVNNGGNCSGIPTPQGFLFFDKRFKGKPMVFVGTVGLIPEKIGGKPSYEKQAKPGDYIVMVGGKVGLDGIHGATFSSVALDSGSPATAVQIGDPITQKKLSDAIVKEARHDGVIDGIADTQRLLSEVLVNEARDCGLYNSITDNGAGGLSCSVAEMAQESGGCDVWLEKVPLKYPGLQPWEIWISESQERMTLAVPPHKWDRFQKLMESRGVEATIIGKFTDTGKCQVSFHGKIIMDVAMDFLHDGLPPRPMKTKLLKPTVKKPILPKLKDSTPLFYGMLSRLNTASFEFISNQYDHEVQAGLVLKPIQGRGRINADATVIRPVLNSQKAVVLSQGINPHYSDIDTYTMAACAIDTAVRNAVTVGGNIDYMALLDNFCWCSSNEPERLYQLKLAVKACYDYAVAYQTPFISGKDSMFNDFKGFDKHNNPIKVSIPPTLLISSIGVIPDAAKVVSLDAKFAGDLVYMLGETFDEMGASEYFWYLNEKNKKDAAVAGILPKVNAKKNKIMYQTYFKAVQKNIITSAISVGLGGLGLALAKTAMGGELGLEINLNKVVGKTTRDDFTLFSESQGRILVTINPKNKNSFEKLFARIPHSLIGMVTNTDAITITDKGKNVIVKADIQTCLDHYRSPFKGY